MPCASRARRPELNSLLLLVPISLVLLGLAASAFVWAVRGGQYDDLDTPSIDILRADPPAVDPPSGGPDAG